MRLESKKYLYDILQAARGGGLSVKRARGSRRRRRRRPCEGREMLEAILLEAERAGQRSGSSGWRCDFTSLRRRLGLEPPAGPR